MRRLRFDQIFEDKVCDRLAIAVLVLVGLFVALTFRDYGLSWDDYTHSEYGDLLVAYFASGLSDRRVFEFVNLYRYGGGFDLAAALLAKISPFSLFETRRLLGGVVGLVGIAVTWRIGRRIGGPLTGLIATLLIATCPLMIGHMMMNPKDAPFAVAMAILLLGLVRVVDAYPQPSRGDRAVFGVGLGLAIGTRILAGLNVLAVAPALALIVVAQARRDGLHPALRRFGHFLLSLIVAMIAAYAIVALVWPWGVADPLNPFRALAYFSRFFEEPWRELFAGQSILVPDMPRSYVPTLLALKLPEIMLVLGTTGLIGALVGAARSHGPINRRATLLLVALAAALPVAITVAERPARYNGIRHFVFVLPPLAVLGGLAAVWVAGWLRERSRPTLYGAAAVLLIGILSPVVEMMRLHPFEYTHFNRIAGGVRGADGRYMIDYWGLSFKQAADALSAHLNASGEQPPSGKWRIAVCGPHRPVQVALGQDNVETTWDPKGAQFAITLGVFYCARLDAPLIAEITRAGVIYARVYDLRGRMVDNLLTQPGLTPLK